MLTIIIVFIILFLPSLPAGTGSTLVIFKTNQETLLSPEFPDTFCLPKLNGKERPFLEGCKNGDQMVRLSPRALG